MHTSSRRTYHLIAAALVAALMAVCSWISFPLPITQIPITLGTLGAMLAGILIGPVWGTIGVLVFLLLGAAGAPVFHGVSGGIGILVGPTGGYLVGYLFISLITGFFAWYLSGKEQVRRRVFTMVIVGGALGTAVCYLLGTIWFMRLQHMALMPALAACVFPFLPGDAIKIVVAALLSFRLMKLVRSNLPISR